MKCVYECHLFKSIVHNFLACFYIAVVGLLLFFFIHLIVESAAVVRIRFPTFPLVAVSGICAAADQLNGNVEKKEALNKCIHVGYGLVGCSACNSIYHIIKFCNSTVMQLKKAGDVESNRKQIRMECMTITNGLQQQQEKKPEQSLLLFFQVADTQFIDNSFDL